jgi:aerobic-type carbon monoxide dehydrogenase small subunit (CoxS/CutS family)
MCNQKRLSQNALERLWEHYAQCQFCNEATILALDELLQRREDDDPVDDPVDDSINGASTEGGGAQ